MSGLLHLRLTVPTELGDDVRDLLTDNGGICNVTYVRGASLEPVGDVFEADVARELVSSVVTQLRQIGVAERGGIVLTRPAATPFDQAARIEHDAPGEADDAVIWDVVLDQAESAATPTVSYYLFLLLATMLAGVAIITDSPVLVVGAMVVGPEFMLIAAICTGLGLGHFRLVRRSLVLLLSGFAFAIVVTAALAWLGLRTGFIDPLSITGARPLTGFIWKPDKWSFVVALLAGAAGVLAMATDKSNAMVGVFISVTTVPAAGGMALGLALWDVDEFVGSAAQLGLNFGGLIASGFATILALRGGWAYAESRDAAFFHRARSRMIERRAHVRD